MPTLQDIYSSIQSVPGRVSNFVQNPITGLKDMVNDANKRAGALNKLTSEATDEGMTFGPKTRELAGKLADAYNPVGMTVWHGSPHTFARFDTGRIGSGVGAQAYGKGLYFSEHPDIASGYARTVKDKQALKDIEKQEQSLASQMERHTDAWGNLSSTGIDLFQKARDLAGQRIGILNNPGNLYKVDLPDTHIANMLHWDEPIKNQAKPIQKLASQYGISKTDLGGDLLSKVGKSAEGTKIMQDAGITGIKYQDPGNLGKYENASNYVVFDPNHVSILDRVEAIK
jgi:hypothetical protein